MKIKVKKRQGLSGDAEFASVSDAKTITQKDIAREIEDSVGIPAIRSMSVLEAFAELARKNIAAGNVVEIEGIGRIRISVTMKDGNPSVNKLIVTPGKALKSDLNNINFEIEVD